MKHLERMTSVWGPGRLHEALERAGIESTVQQCEALLLHRALVLEANQRMNLTRIVGPDDFVWLNIVDSLAFLSHVARLDGQILDLGSGAGFPGIPLAIMGHQLTLCEATQKKARFLEECAATLGLDVTVLALRAEEVAAQRPASADIVVARAVSSLASLVELAAPLLRHGGRLVTLKGAPSDEEVERAVRAAGICGMRASSSGRYMLETGERRSLYEYVKGGKPKIALPRRAGTAQKEPLG